MKRALEHLIAARTERTERLRAAFLEAYDVFADPRMCVPLMTAAATVAGPLKLPCSRELEREVASIATALGARLYAVADRRLLRGVRRRGQSVAEAVRESVETKRWARDRGGRSSLIQGEHKKDG